MAETEGLKARDYADAVTVQDACNLSGVVLSFAEIIPRLNAEMRRLGRGTEWRNRHPICVLFAAKIADLAGVPSYQQGPYIDALDECRHKASLRVRA